jgi:hypothetical protein
MQHQDGAADALTRRSRAGRGCASRRLARLLNALPQTVSASDHVRVVDPIAEILKPVLGRPSWLVQLGYGPFITMEFGEPRVHVSDPVLRKIHIDGAPEHARAGQPSAAIGICGSTAATGPCWATPS